MKSFFKKIVIAILTWEARLVLKKYRPKIVAITGSVGKTSTKDAVYAVLAKHARVRKSEKSFNGELGVPLTILGLPTGWNNPLTWLRNIFRGFFLVFATNYKLQTTNYPEWLILEVGADHPGDIERIARWLRPDAVAVTRFGETPVHVEFFHSRAELIAEKSFLVKSLKPNGLLLLNGDDEDVRTLRDMRRDVTVVTWGIEHEAHYEASNLEYVYAEENGMNVPTGITFKVNHAGNSVPLTVSGTLGRSQVYPALAAVAFGEHIGLNMVEMGESIHAEKTAPGRMKLVAGVRRTIIIDDTYNASPVAMREALRTLKEVHSAGKKIAVLGDMRELGRYSLEEHQKAGKYAKDSCDVLVTVGIRARGIAEGALDYGMDEKNIFQFDTAAEAAKPVEHLIAENDIILVKGSQAVRMECIVEEIMAHPELKSELLVRQEEAWIK